MKDRKLKVFVLVLVMTILASALLMGCKKAEPTLESYVKDNPSEQSAIEDLLASEDNAEIEFIGNKMRIVYTVTEEELKSFEGDVATVMEEAFGVMEETFEGVIDELERITEIQGIQIEIAYLDSEGTEIASYVYGEQSIE